MSIAQGISYAEAQLQVHQINDDARELMNILNNDYQTRANLETESRNLNFKMEQRKMQIISDRHHSIEESIAAHERAVKMILADDEEYQSYAARANEIMGHRDVLNATIAGRENNLKGHVARMGLLGGYFSFLASLKEGETVDKLNQTSSPF